VKYGCNAEPIREIINGRIFSMIVTSLPPMVLALNHGMGSITT